MNKKALSTVLVVVVILLVGYLFYAHNKAQAPTTESNQTQDASATADNKTSAETPPTGQTQTIQNAGGSDYKPAPTPTPTLPPNGTRFSGEGDIEGNDVMVYEVDYDGVKFSPASQKVKIGDIVVFKNTGTANFHPIVDTKATYPEFDSKTAIAAGQDFQFKFVKIGTWAYHDALNAAAKASITVTK